jgi:hypothetical protein
VVLKNLEYEGIQKNTSQVGRKVKKHKSIYILVFWIPIVKISAEKYPVEGYTNTHQYGKWVEKSGKAYKGRYR